MAKKGVGEIAGTAIGFFLLGATVYGAWHGVDRHDRSWSAGLFMPPLAWYYAAESAWHSDGRAEFCGKLAECRDTLGEPPRDYDGCMRKTEIALTGESSSRHRDFEVLAKKVDKMTCKELAEWVRQQQGANK